jgi:nucleoside-diphosphate-sugar epimerase
LQVLPVLLVQKVGELLLSEGHIVVGVDSLEDSHDIRLKQVRLEQLKRHEKFKFIQVNISDNESLLKGLYHYKHFDGIFNFAIVEGDVYWEKKQKYVEMNISGVLNLLDWSRQQGVKKYIQASSANVYGLYPAVLPTPETAVTQDLIQMDAITQKTAESLAYSYHAKYSIDVAVFRYFNVYGPACRPDGLIFKLCRSIYERETVAVVGDGAQRSGFSYIDDVARGTVQGLVLSGYEVINLGGHELISLKKLINLLEEGIEKQAVLEQLANDVSLTITRFPDLHKAKQLLDWTPKVALVDGILNVIEWYANERHWARFLH